MMVEEIKCTGCSACFSACPMNAITMKQDKEGFLFPKINLEKCVDCKLCEAVCPISKEPVSRVVLKVFGSYSKDELIRQKSSSGGLFTEFAMSVLNDKGIVVGCRMSEDLCKAEHVIVSSSNDLYLLQGSKYMQSDLQSIFASVKRALEEGKKVLFSGTPCQVAGLKAFLKTDYSELYTIDFICHGTPSPKVWNSYIKWKAQQHKESKIKQVLFRDKSESWNRYRLTVNFEDGYVTSESTLTDEYLRTFIGNYSLRKSCYNCVFKLGNYYSDITLGDFWGIEEVMPEWDNGKGVSLLGIRSSKGERLFSSIVERIAYFETSPELAFAHNKSIDVSADWNHWRFAFFSDLDRMSFDSLYSKYLGNSLFDRLKRHLFSKKSISK